MIKKISTTLGALAIAFSLNSCSSEESEPTQPEKTAIEHTLQTTPSEDKEFDAKVLELAKLAFTKPKGTYEPTSFDENGLKVNVVYASFEENGNKYLIVVGDYDEKTLEGVVSIPEQPIADGIKLQKESSENEKEGRYLRISNSGLNGNVFEALTYVFDKSADPESFTPKDMKEHSWLSEDTENKQFFYQELRKLVDELLAIYKRE